MEGLKKILQEQLRPKQGAQPSRGGSTQPPKEQDTNIQQGDNTVPQQQTTPPVVTTNQQQPVVTQPSKDTLRYFNDFTFYDQDEKEVKFSDDEKKMVMDLNGNFGLTADKQPKMGGGTVQRVTSQPTQTGSTTPNQTQPRPEQAMGVAPKPEAVVKVAETQGTIPAMKTLNDEQKRVVQRYSNEGWETSKPADADMNMYDTIDLKGIESAFDTFPTFKMYKIKRLGTTGLEAIASGLTSQDVTEDSCKTYIKTYHDGAMDRKTMSDGARK